MRIKSAVYEKKYDLSRSVFNIHLIMLYFDQPDAIAHTYGPVHEKTGNVVEEMDLIIRDLRSKIRKLPYGDRVNLIVTSDHGMGETSPDRYVNINEHIDVYPLIAHLLGLEPADTDGKLEDVSGMLMQVTLH